MVFAAPDLETDRGGVAEAADVRRYVALGVVAPRATRARLAGNVRIVQQLLESFALHHVERDLLRPTVACLIELVAVNELLRAELNQWLPREEGCALHGLGNTECPARPARGGRKE